MFNFVCCAGMTLQLFIEIALINFTHLTNETSCANFFLRNQNEWLRGQWRDKA